jgi:hypothetical protein
LKESEPLALGETQSNRVRYRFDMDIVMSDLFCEYGNVTGECRHPDILPLIDKTFIHVRSEMCRNELCQDFKPNENYVSQFNPHVEVWQNS